uniref:Cilia- and flagella-associated protein HOATZ n=1 Tax=Varanus komodoensis TaxID=61221 RepID=A0A8D2LQ98_VARKO
MAAGRPPAGAALVFSGCSQQDAALAKSFWNSVTLQPPLESRLVPRRDSDGGGGAGSRKGSGVGAGTRGSREGSLEQRSGVARLGSRLAALQSQMSSCGSSQEKEEEQDLEDTDAKKTEVKARYLEKAKKREEIIALLKKQREERILKESISHLHKPKSKPQESKVKVPESNLEDQESVKALA